MPHSSTTATARAHRLHDLEEIVSPLSPQAPQVAAELGLPSTLITQVALRYIREHHRLTLTAFRKGLKISYAIAEKILDEFRQHHLVEVKGVQGRDFVFSLTEEGREEAATSLSQCSYAGPMPVPLNQYTRTVRAQRLKFHPCLEDMQRAMADLVIPDEVLDQLGASLCSGRPIFVYGPSGTGKSSLIERFPALFGDTILVPYCVEIDGKIMTVFDPAVHSPVELDTPDEGCDLRWVRCRRPCVIAGGELTLEELAPRLDSVSGTYGAPMQVKAANGVFLIDDFGRQIVPPQALFNRWIIPLDRRVDHMSLQYRFTFEMPFEVTLVFSTNLEPADLVDEAFIRRVPNKVHLGPVTPEAFDEIFSRVIIQHNLPVNRHHIGALAAQLRQLCSEHGAPNLRPCYPGDICEIIAAMASYERKPFTLNSQYLARATKLYFMHRSSQN